MKSTDRPTLPDGPTQRLATSRREFLALGIGALVVSAVPFSGFLRRDRLVRRTLPVMGTIADITVVHRDEALAHAAIDDAFAALRRVEVLMTRFRNDSEVGRVNLFAGSEMIDVSDETAEVVKAALHWSDVTGGAFDPCLGKAMELWNVNGRSTPPPASASRVWAAARLYDTIELDASAARPRLGLRSREAALDLGGIAKGYGVDAAAAALRARGVENALVNAGGDLYALGRSLEGDPWRVGIRSPHDPSRIARTITISDQALATSGDYLQYFEYRGRRYHHLLDPRTGEPALTSGCSVTVIADNCTSADAGATAVFAMDASVAEQRLRQAAPGSRLIRLG